MEQFSDSANEDGGWIQWFCDLDGNDFLLEVDEEYIRDQFNLFGLRVKIKNYDKAIEMILGQDIPGSDDFNDPVYLNNYEAAMDLYGLIHSRFILSPKGLAMMREKYLMGTFGVCPRVKCKRHYTMPIGSSYNLNESRVKIYCPKWQEVYAPKHGSIDIDGAYFGPSFPFALIQAYPDIINGEGPEKFIPKLYGFRIFGLRGSHYEIKHDENGNAINKDEINEILSSKLTDAYD